MNRGGFRYPDRAVWICAAPGAIQPCAVIDIRVDYFSLGSNFDCWSRHLAEIDDFFSRFRFFAVVAQFRIDRLELLADCCRQFGSPRAKLFALAGNRASDKRMNNFANCPFRISVDGDRVAFEDSDRIIAALLGQ